MDPTKIEPNQDISAPVSANPLGAERGSIAVDTSNSVVDRPPGVESSHPEIHGTADGFIKPNLSARAPIAEIQTQLNEMGEKIPITSHLNVAPERAHQLTNQPVDSGGRWLGTLIEKFNKLAALFRSKQPTNQPI